MKKQHKKDLLEFANENFRCSEKDIAQFIETLLYPYPVATRTVYWVDARRHLHEHGFTHWKLEIPVKWLEKVNQKALERNKSQKIMYINKNAVHKFIHTEQFTYNPYFSFIRMLIVSGRRVAELLSSSFETRNDDTELWYTPKKKQSVKWFKIEHLLCDYTPSLFHIELLRFHSVFDMSKQTLRIHVQDIMNKYFNTTHLHLCRSIYVLLLRDKFNIQPNNLPYHVGTWLCHERNSASSLRYIQCEWEHPTQKEDDR